MNLPVRAPEIAQAATRAQSPLIQVRDVVKAYLSGDETVRALDGISFDIREGEFVAITGPSGSGKSTMMNLLGGLDVPTAGSVWIGGNDMRELSRDALADLRNQTIGFIFQQPNLLPRTSALRQVMLPLTYSRARPADPVLLARMRLEQVGLGQRCDYYPQQLSGGQQQRVAIARALVNNPKILLADEPTGALDSKTSTEIMELFCALNCQGIAIVVVTHDAGVARQARRKISFRDGTMVEDARLVEL